MKPQIYKWMVLVAMLISLVFVVTNTTAGKPPKPPKPPDDVCASITAPDIAFWRDSRTKGKNRMAQVSVYAAELDSGCEVKLLDIPLPEGPINDLKLAYSSGESDGVFVGRVVWAKHRYKEPQSVWKYDFTIEEGQIVPFPKQPSMIMNIENVGTNLNIEDLDLSPDMQFLAYRLNDYRDVDPDYYRILSLEIDSCIPDACLFSDGKERYVLEEWPDTIEGLRTPVWGPFGDRIYFIERENDTHYVKFIDVTGIQTQALTLFSYTGEERFYQISSGLDASGETMALEIGTDPFIHGCRSIYTLNVDVCENNPQSCELKRLFAGIWPSWTKDGKLIHTYQGYSLKNTCSTNTVGIWDGTKLETLAKGYEPEAAGG